MTPTALHLVGERCASSLISAREQIATMMWMLSLELIKAATAANGTGRVQVGVAAEQSAGKPRTRPTVLWRMWRAAPSPIEFRTWPA